MARLLIAGDAVHRAGFISPAFVVQLRGLLPFYCRVEKWLTHQAHNLKTAGSNPASAPIWYVS